MATCAPARSGISHPRGATLMPLWRGVVMWPPGPDRGLTWFSSTAESGRRRLQAPAHPLEQVALLAVGVDGAGDLHIGVVHQLAHSLQRHSIGQLVAHKGV